MFTTNAYTHLAKITVPAFPTEKHFSELIIYFRESILNEIDFRNRLARHRKPIAYLHEVLRQLRDQDLVIQRRSDLMHIEPSHHGYVTSHVKWLWEEDRSLGSLYNSTLEYCRRYDKPFSVIAIHIAEYRAVIKLASKIARMIAKKTRELPSSNTI